MMIQHYIKVAFRNILKHKGQTVISIIGLSVGILCFCFCAYIFRLQFDQNRDFPNYKQLAYVGWHNDKGGGLENTIEKGKRLIESKITGVRSVSITSFVEDRQFIIQTDSQKETPFILTTMFINEGFLEVTSAKWIVKDSLSIFDRPNSVILTRSGAKRLFNNENPLGKTVALVNNSVEDKSQIYTIVGIIEDLPRSNSFSPSRAIDMYICWGDDVSNDYRAILFVLRSPRVSWDELNKRMKEIQSLGIMPEDRGGDVFYPILDKIEVDITNLRPVSMLMLILGFIVLLSGLINFFSICVAAFYNRTKELSIRKGLGAANYGPFFLLFIESSIVVLGAAVVSVVLTELVIPYFEINFSSIDRLEIHIPTLLKQQFQYFPGLLLLNALIAYVVSYRLKRMVITAGIRGGSRDGNKHRVRNVLLGFQFFITILFFGAATMIHFQFLSSKEAVAPTLSYKEKQQVFEVKLDYPQLTEYKEIIFTKLKTARSIQDILKTKAPFYYPSSVSYYNIEGKETQLIYNIELSDNFVSFFHLPFTPFELNKSNQSIMLNQDLYNRLGDERQTGIIVLDSIGYRIAGVVDNYRNAVVDVVPYLVFKPLTQYNYLYVKCYPGYENETVRFINQTIREWLPSTITYDVRNMHELIEVNQKAGEILRNIMMILTIVCLVITSLGVFSAVAVDTEKKQKEVAIRKINGAGFKDIIWLFARLYFGLLITASLFALPLLWLITKSIIEKFPVQFNYNNPFIWFSIICIMIVLTAIVVGYRLLLVARINPAEVIKNE